MLPRKHFSGTPRGVPDKCTPKICEYFSCEFFSGAKKREELAAFFTCEKSKKKIKKSRILPCKNAFAFFAILKNREKCKFPAENDAQNH